MPIYQLLIRILSPLIWLIIAIEAIKSRGGWRFFLQKMGLSFPPLKQSQQNPIWIHCASVGEVKAAETLVRALLPKHAILITTNTATSKPLVNQLFGDQVSHRYLPFDWPFALRRFIKINQPSRLWVMETEIWPNLFRVANKQQLELCILNGRLTEKTFKTPGWLQAAYRNSLRRVDKIIARSEEELPRFVKLGADPQRIQVLGNIKYSAQPEAQSQVRPIERDYILAASTHNDEELQITQLWLKQQRPELLVIVPRHPKRSERIQKQLAFLGDKLQVASRGEQPNADTQVFLDDRIGKLIPLYAYAKLVIMGGSFAPKGGHNILEPAAFRKAILSGPDYRDFKEEMALLQNSNGIVICADYEQLSTQLSDCLQQPDRASTLGKNAYQALQAQQNTLKNYLTALHID